MNTNEQKAYPDHKSLTFDKVGQEALPQHIKDKMKANQDSAKEQKALELEAERYANTLEYFENIDSHAFSNGLVNKLIREAVIEAYKVGKLSKNETVKSGEWISVKERLPEEQFVLAFGLNENSKQRRIRARFVAPFSEIADMEFNDENYDYSDEEDEYFLKSGWYESNDCEEINWRVSYDITHWMTLPNPPQNA